MPLGSSKQSPTNTAQLASRATEARASTSSNMIFSDIYKSPRSPIAKLRHHSVQLPTPLPTNTPDWYGEEHADLLSKDKVKQKEAVKRYLDVKVKNDWEFPWPSRVVEPPLLEGDVAVVDTASETPDAIEAVTSLDVTEPTKSIQDETHGDDGYQVDDPESSDNEDDSDAESTYSTVSEDLVNFRTRLDWASDLSDDEDEPGPSRSPFRFDNPDNVGSTVQAVVQGKRAKRRRAVRKEMEWNEGLACFEARRNAWTGARTVRVRAKPATPLLCHHYLPVDSSSVAPCQHLLLPRQSRLLYHRKSVMRQTTRHSREATSFAMLDLKTPRRRHLPTAEIILLRSCFLSPRLSYLPITLCVHPSHLLYISVSTTRSSFTAFSPRALLICPICFELALLAGSEMASGLPDRQWLPLLSPRRRNPRSPQTPQRTRAVLYAA
uniref:Gag1-like clamp domain-containing protein n=1 Tax=Fusarium oxysporum (strain Fo5176) TaxID=660025 RepID=A0A0D2YC75_FUSOF